MSQRLTEEDWLVHGLTILSQSGFTALKAEPMAKSLGVSRGSFYWHFKDIKDYHCKLLTLWHTRFTWNVITEVEAQFEPHEKLAMLMTLAYDSENGTEAAVRNWAQHNQEAQDVLETVDKARLTYLQQLLNEAGLEADVAAARAWFIYAAALGRTLLSENEDSALSEDDIKALAQMMTA